MHPLTFLLSMPMLSRFSFVVDETTRESSYRLSDTSTRGCTEAQSRSYQSDSASHIAARQYVRTDGGRDDRVSHHRRARDRGTDALCGDSRCHSDPGTNCSAYGLSRARSHTLSNART